MWLVNATSKIDHFTPASSADVNSQKRRLGKSGSVGMGPSSSSNSGNVRAERNMHDKALADMVAGLRDEAINRGATALMDDDVTFKTRNKRSSIKTIRAIRLRSTIPTRFWWFI